MPKATNRAGKSRRTGTWSMSRRGSGRWNGWAESEGLADDTLLDNTLEALDDSRWPLSPSLYFNQVALHHATFAQWSHQHIPRFDGIGDRVVDSHSADR